MTKPSVDAAAVEILARAAGIEIPAERRALVAERLNEMYAMAAEFESVPYRSFDPAAVFVPFWPPGVDELLDLQGAGEEGGLW